MFEVQEKNADGKNSKLLRTKSEIIMLLSKLLVCNGKNKNKKCRFYVIHR